MPGMNTQMPATFGTQVSDIPAYALFVQSTFPTVFVECFQGRFPPTASVALTHPATTWLPDRPPCPTRHYGAVVDRMVDYSAGAMETGRAQYGDTVMSSPPALFRT
jgi:hypothetical protein